MKTNSKKWILGLSALAFAGCLTFACGATINASADETQQPTVTATANENIKFRGISIRYNQVDGQDGIRFGTLINKDWYDALQGEVTTATVIVPTEFLASEDYAGVMAAAEKEVVETTDLLTYTVTIDDVTYYKPTVYIHSIDEVYYNTELTALSYVAIDGEVTYYTGELLQHSVASAAKWLVENGKEEVNDMKDYLYYTVTYRDTDGSVLDTQRVKYGKTPEFKGTIPAKRGYLFTGFGEMSAVTEDAEYTAQYYDYKPFTNYYYEANKVVQLPTFETNFGEEVLTYTLNNAQVDPANVNMPAGTYTYSVRVGDIDTIEDTITFYDRETYETTFVKANSDQHLNYFIVNGNNSLTYNATENAYQFNATTSSQWDSRLNLNPAILMGENAEYDETKYNSMKFDLKIAETTALPTALS